MSTAARSSASSVSKRPGRPSVWFRMMLWNSSPASGPLAGDAAQLLRHFDHRFLRLVGLHRRHDVERPRPARGRHRRLGAVAPVLVEAQVAVQARRRHAAEVAHHRLDRQILRQPAALGDVGGDDHRLRRVRLVDQVDLAAGAARDRADRLLRRRRRGPSRRRPCSSAGSSCAIVTSPVTISVLPFGVNHVAVPAQQIVAGDRLDRRLVAGPGERVGVGVRRAVEQPRQRRAAPRPRIGLLLADLRHLPRASRARPDPPGTTGFSTTSAMSCSDGPRLAGSACSRTNDRSSELRVESGRRARRARRRRGRRRASTCRRRAG